MTGEGSGKVSRVDVVPFEKEMCLVNDTSVKEVRVLYVKPKTLYQLEEWMHPHVNQTYPDVVRMWKQFHDCPTSGGGIERVFFSVGKQHDALKKETMDKSLENTLKTSINTKLPTCDDKVVFTDDQDTYRKRK
jgi:hypothetical protein